MSSAIHGGSPAVTAHRGRFIVAFGLTFLQPVKLCVQALPSHIAEAESQRAAPASSRGVTALESQPVSQGRRMQ